MAAGVNFYVNDAEVNICAIYLKQVHVNWIWLDVGVCQINIQDAVNVK